MRDIKTLLEILLNQYQKHPDDVRSLGLCDSVKHIYHHNLINPHEREVILDVIKSNRPAGLGSAYWWPKGETEPRIEFLKKLISEL